MAITSVQPTAGHTVHASYRAGFIVLSYFVSLIGCTTALELLHRRTSRHGAFNWYLLSTSSITMGGIGIWCMHFIGNRAIVLGDGMSDAQLLYNSGFTALSFFLPIGVLLGAFYLLGVTEKHDQIYIVLSGILTGAAVCGMHYVGQLGITNYHCHYLVGHIIGSAIIAVFASLVALSVFFRFRAAWTNQWWKRLSCASILACAVSGMHWTATVGTSYRFKGEKYNTGSGLSRSQTVIICTILACVACFLLLIFAIIANRTKTRDARRAQQVVLACAYFDDQGRIMVTPEGILPNHKITNKYLERTFGADDFSKTHPAFLWGFRASRNWKSIRDLIPGMKEDLASHESMWKPKFGHSKPLEDECEMETEFAAIFKELFCVAASHLAEEIHQPLEKLGVLYEAPLSTGTVEMGSVAEKFGMFRGKKAAPAMLDVESAHSYVFGRGQFLFVCRQVSKDDAIRLQASGFRFAMIPQIADFLSRSMQISTSEIAKQMDEIHAYSKGQQMLEPGIHVACFMLRPTVQQGFDVLVKSSARNQLPLATLPIPNFDRSQQATLTSMDEWTVAAMLKSLKSEPDHTFGQQLYHAIAQLAANVEDPAFMQAKFSARPIRAPCRSRNQSGTSGKCTLLCIRLISNIAAREPNASHVYAPLQLFNAQQQVYPGAADIEAFDRQIHREFFRNSVERRKAIHSSRGAPAVSRSGSQTNLVPLPSSHRRSEAGDPPSTPDPYVADNGKFVGIMVTENVSVDVSGDNGDGIDPREALGTKADAVADPVELATYVDEMMALLRS